MRSVAIIQTYLPEYRVAFFKSLRQSLNRRDIELKLYTSIPTGVQEARGDAYTAPWAQQVQVKQTRLAKRDVRYFKATRIAERHDGIILGLEGKSPDVFELLVRRKHGAAVGLWGHVGSYVQRHSRMDAALERWQMRRASHVFAYTPSGASVARKAGVPRSRITTVMNTVEISPLLDLMHNISRPALASFMRQHRLTPNKTLAFIGGLDESKRVPFLKETLDILWERDPDITLVVVGTGAHRNLLDPAIERGQVSCLGYSQDEQKALALLSCRYIVMPGRIGLVAVEALASGIPVITTDWPYHAPEAEYLSEGTSRFTSSNAPEEFADLVVRLLQTQIAPPPFIYPRLSQMVSNFTQGVSQMLDDGPA